MMSSFISASLKFSILHSILSKQILSLLADISTHSIFISINHQNTEDFFQWNLGSKFNLTLSIIIYVVWLWCENIPIPNPGIHVFTAVSVLKDSVDKGSFHTYLPIYNLPFSMFSMFPMFYLLKHFIFLFKFAFFTTWLAWYTIDS